MTVCESHIRELENKTSEILIKDGKKVEKKSGDFKNALAKLHEETELVKRIQFQHKKISEIVGVYIPLEIEPHCISNAHYEGGSEKKIIIYLGLVLDYDLTDEELLFVIAHEYGHFLHGDALKPKPLIATPWNTIWGNELFADIEGLKLIKKLGYSINSSLSFFKKGIGISGYFSNSHPPYSMRIINIIIYEIENNPKYESYRKIFEAFSKKYGKFSLQDLFFSAPNKEAVEYLTLLLESNLNIDELSFIYLSTIVYQQERQTWKYEFGFGKDILERDLLVITEMQKLGYTGVSALGVLEKLKSLYGNNGFNINGNSIHRAVIHWLHYGKNFTITERIKNIRDKNK